VTGSHSRPRDRRAEPPADRTVGTSQVYATWVSGSGTDTLTFHDTVQPGDPDLDGIAVVPHSA
jgi:hypothetical protein